MISRVCCPVTERRLKPIYDSLDNGNNKKALQEAEKVIKKQPELHCAKALKCLALLRLGKESECSDLLESIKNDTPVDEATLQLMTLCYRDINKPDEICEIYDKASKKVSQNEEILSNLFISYVRVGDYKNQLRSALSLTKNNKTQYAFWEVISCLLQSVKKPADLLDVFTEPIYSPHICAKDRPYAYNYLEIKQPVEDEKKYIKFAEKKLETLINEVKVLKDQEFLIYIIVLDMLDKYEHALNILDKQSILDENTHLNYKLAFLAKLNEWKKINTIVKERLEKGLEGWNYFLYYIDSAFELNKDDEKYFNEAEIFIESLIQKSKMKKREHFLARLEICSRFSKFSNLLDYLVDYFKEFGTKEVCVYDLKPYLHLLSADNSTEFLRLIWEPTKNVKSTRARMEYHICHEEFARVMDCKVCDRKTYVAQLMQCFIDALEFNSDLLSTEMRSSDRYALIASFTLYDLWTETSESIYLVEAITICHYALSKSPSNSQLKILLLKFYHLLGCPESAHNAYISLDIKHMQLDTLGYLHVFPLISNACYAHAISIILLTLKFFQINKRDSGENVTNAYRYEAFTKIPEMIAIKEKLNNSIHYYLSEVERMLLLIFQANNVTATVEEFNVFPETDTIPWSSLEDNRDFKVLWDLEPQSKSLTSQEIQVSRNFDLTYLSLRSCLLRIIVASVYLGSSNLERIEDLDCQKEENYFVSYKNILITLIKSLEDDVEKMKGNPPKPCLKKPSIKAPPKSRLLLMFSRSYFDIVVNGLRFLLSVIPGREVVEEESKYRLGVIMMLSEELTNFPIKNFDAAKRSEMIQICSLFVEIASISCIIIEVANTILAKVKILLSKKNKKKKDSKIEAPELEWRANMLNKFVIYASDMIKNIDCILKSEENVLFNDVKHLSDSYDLSDFYELVKKDGDVLYLKEFNELKSISENVYDNIIKNHKSSLNDMSAILKSKLKYLNGLKI